MALALFTVSCGSDDAAKAPEAPATASRHAMTSNVWGTEGATGYLYTVESLSEGEANLDNAIELPGGAWLTGREQDRFVYVSSGEGGPTITRWEVLQDGSLEEGPTISFANSGFTMGMRFATAPILSEEKAYLVDFQQQRIATWNPRDMTVGELIELELEPRDGLPAWLPTIVLRDDKLFVTVVWEEDWKFASSSRVIAIDTETDKVVETSDDERCEQLAVSSVDSQGTAYYTPYAHSPVAREVLGEGYGTKSCGVRIVASDSAFDEGWQVDLSALADGRPAGEFVLASDDVGFFRVFYNDEVQANAENWQDKQGVPGYRWWRWEIGTEQAEEIPNQELTVEAGRYFVDGKTYVGNPSADWSATTIVELDAGGELREGLTVQGTPGGVVLIR
jgi:hypothetical protein